MAVICPTVTAYDPHEYRDQIEQIEPFASRIHIDLMDGEFTPNKSPSLEEVWWPENLIADLHLMFQHPSLHIDQLIKLRPNLVVIHLEADTDHKDFAEQMNENGIKAGISLLQETSLEEALSIIPNFDHVMVYSGHLGEHGGEADLKLLEKVRQIKEQFPDKEIGWDGGISEENAKALVEGGVDVLNTGGAIQRSDNPALVYEKILEII